MTLPTYNFRPSWSPGTESQLRSCASRRSRLTIGGTYFRSKLTGKDKNNISIELVQLTPTNGPNTGEAYLVVTNHNVKASEMVLGAQSTFINLSGTYADLWRIDQLNTSTPRCNYYSISLRIRNRIENGPPYDLDLDPDDEVTSTIEAFQLNRLFSSQGKLSVQLTGNASNFASGDVVSITPRIKIYRLNGKISPPTDTDPAGTPVWDIADLRTRVNAEDKWIEMPPRSGPSPENPNPTIFDVQDEGFDAITLTPFAQTFMEGADGLPDNPASERTGPFRSIVHLNYEENEIGDIREVNVVYEWVGDSAVNGSWRPYA